MKYLKTYKLFEVMGTNQTIYQMVNGIYQYIIDNINNDKLYIDNTDNSSVSNIRSIDIIDILFLPPIPHKYFDDIKFMENKYIHIGLATNGIGGRAYKSEINEVDLYILLQIPSKDSIIKDEKNLKYLIGHEVGHLYRRCLNNRDKNDDEKRAFWNLLKFINTHKTKQTDYELLKLIYHLDDEEIGASILGLTNMDVKPFFVFKLAKKFINITEEQFVLIIRKSVNDEKLEEMDIIVKKLYGSYHKLYLKFVSKLNKIYKKLSKLTV